MLVVSEEGATVCGYTLVRVNYNGGPDSTRLAAACAQLYDHCKRFEVSMRVSDCGNDRIVVGIFVHFPRRATVPYGVTYTLEFEKQAVQTEKPRL